MLKNGKGNPGQLPKKRIDSFTATFKRFIYLEATSSLFLFLFTLVALVVSNSPWGKIYLTFWDQPLGFYLGSNNFSLPLKQWVNDGLMTFFFFVVALELKREIILGELQQLKLASLSFCAAIGGMIVPALFYAMIAGDGPFAHGWGTVVATDTAFVIGCLALLGSRIPGSLKAFLLTLAIFDDIGAILIIAITYSEAFNIVPVMCAMLGISFILFLSWLGVRSFLLYFAEGSVIWVSLKMSGLHPTLAGVILGFLTPARAWISDTRLHAILARVMAYPPGEHWGEGKEGQKDLLRANIATREAISPIEQLELKIHPWVAFAILPTFALANAGIPLSFMHLDWDIALPTFIGLLIGKPLGVIFLSFLAIKLGVAVRPIDLTWKLLISGSLLTGVGLTMSLFIADEAYSFSDLHTAKISILIASFISGCIGLAALYVASRNKD